MLASAEELSADGDDAIGRHCAGDPLVAGAINRDRRVEGQVGGEGASTEALQWGRHTHLLVGPLGVVFVHPRVELLLKVLERGEGSLTDELATQGVVDRKS